MTDIKIAVIETSKVVRCELKISRAANVTCNTSSLVVVLPGFLVEDERMSGWAILAVRVFDLYVTSIDVLLVNVLNYSIDWNLLANHIILLCSPACIASSHKWSKGFSILIYVSNLAGDLFEYFNRHIWTVCYLIELDSTSYWELWISLELNWLHSFEIRVCLTSRDDSIIETSASALRHRIRSTSLHLYLWVGL